MRVVRGLLLAAGLTAGMMGAARAGLQDDVPSCYVANHIQPADGVGYSRLIYVLIDQTVGWTTDLESSVMENLNRNLTPGTKFVIAEFSAFSQGRYLEVLHTGIIEEPLPASQVGSTPIQAAKILSECLGDQLPYAVKMADDATVAALQGSSSSLNNSDIMSALSAVSAVVAADPAKQRLVFLATDGLENSGVTSFYRHGAIRNIDPAHELALAAANGLVGDFGGADVYVIGGALAPGSGAGLNDAYRSPQELKHLAAFWSGYFQKSNARLVAFGEPALLQPVGFAGP